MHLNISRTRAMLSPGLFNLGQKQKGSVRRLPAWESVFSAPGAVASACFLRGANSALLILTIFNLM